MLHLVMPGNGRNTVFRGKQASSKIPLLRLDVKILKERFERSF